MSPEDTRGMQLWAGEKKVESVHGEELPVPLQQAGFFLLRFFHFNECAWQSQDAVLKSNQNTW